MPRPRLRPCRVAICRLEPREAPAVVTWDGGAGTSNWSDPINWDTDKLPQPGDDVVINTTATVVFSDQAGTASINKITCDAPFVLNGGTLAVAGPGTFSKNVQHVAGTLLGNGDVTFSGQLLSTGG